MDYNDIKPLKIDWNDLSLYDQLVLTENPSFCMYPWTHLHAYPDNTVHLCCMSEMDMPVGNLNDNTLEEIWHSDNMQTIRQKMIDGIALPECTKCYEQDKNGFMSGRVSANKHFGHHIAKARTVEPEYEIVYWDVRFSNLCNFRCRTCGPLFSSNWYQDYVKLHPNSPTNSKVIKANLDIEECLRHIPYVEQIYFAGGEPLMMAAHWEIIAELLKQNRTDVKLIYNTNFSQLKYKQLSILDMWKEFDSVSIGASLDGSGIRGEYIRKETVWKDIVDNREQMLRVCPDVDFYISCTLSILNSYHMPDFHREWIDYGLIKAPDFNVNILMNPPHYRIDNLPMPDKEAVIEKYNEHIDYISPLDTLQRATNGYKSAINFIEQPSIPTKLDEFKELTNKMDTIRNESFNKTFPEFSFNDD